MRVLTWNVQGAVPPFGSKKRIRDQMAFIEERAELPDLLLLNEVTTVQRERWREASLGELERVVLRHDVDRHAEGLATDIVEPHARNRDR